MNDQVLIVDVTLDNFNEVVIDGSVGKYVLIDFWADWCEPCKTLTPLLEQIASSYQGEIVLAKINCDEQQQIVAQFGVRSLPTVVLFKEGQAIDGFTGGSTEAEIRKMLGQHIPEPIKKEIDVFEQAKNLFTQGHREQAINLLKELLSNDNTNVPALILYARCLAEQGGLDQAETILDSITDEGYKQELSAVKAQLTFLKQASALPSITEIQTQLREQPDSDDLKFQLIIALLAQQAYEQAMGELLALFKSNRAYQDDLPRKTLIQLFDLLGNEHPLVATYRKKLYQALY